MRQWQLYILFGIGVVGLIFEIGFSAEIRPLALATDLVLVGLLPVDIIYRQTKEGSNNK